MEWEFEDKNENTLAILLPIIERVEKDMWINCCIECGKSVIEVGMDPIGEGILSRFETFLEDFL